MIFTATVTAWILRLAIARGTRTGRLLSFLLSTFGFPFWSRVGVSGLIVGIVVSVRIGIGHNRVHVLFLYLVLLPASRPFPFSWFGTLKDVALLLNSFLFVLCKVIKLEVWVLLKTVMSVQLYDASKGKRAIKLLVCTACVHRVVCFLCYGGHKPIHFVFVCGLFGSLCAIIPQIRSNLST